MLRSHISLPLSIKLFIISRQQGVRSIQETAYPHPLQFNPCSFPHTLLPSLSGCIHTLRCHMQTLEVKNKSCFEFEGRHFYGCRCHTRCRDGAGFLLLLAIGEQMLGLWMKLPLTDKSHTIGSLAFDLLLHWRDSRCSHRKMVTACSSQSASVSFELHMRSCCCWCSLTPWTSFLASLFSGTGLIDSEVK